METLHAAMRVTGRGGQTTNALRRTGWIPAVVYGSEIGNLPIKVKALELDQLLRKQPTNVPLTLSVDGQEYAVMMYELQRHPVQGNVLHADFKQINLNEKVHTTVPVVLTGHPEYGIASLVRHSVEISCLPKDIPETFTANVEGMQVGDVILVKDLNIAQGIDLELDEMEVIVSILPTKAASDESIEAEGEAEAQAEKADSPVNEAAKV
ncbi:50S ribosomal protein L25 [Brevibacillus sp. B_LB10_24]|jgi:large subunit ribosomal protein L25|uniref:50S ribosomal protein L25 n=1 Tax=Brevibacillus TaxID=55080 RepID=UPI000315C5EC|nr:50S ribosomal protein L25 [Brevibacillus massiliensis]